MPLPEIIGANPKPGEQDAPDTASELTPEIVKGHPLYQDVLSESIDRRKQIKALKEELAALKSEPEATDQPDPQPETPEAPPELTAFEQKLAALADMVTGLTKTIEQQSKDRVELHRKDLISRHKIPEQLHPLVLGETVEELDTKVKALLPFLTPATDSTSVANPASQSPEAEMERIRKKVVDMIDGGPTQDIFDASLQQSLGGGILHNPNP